MDSTFGVIGGDVSSFASPLEQVFRNVPKAHEKPLRQAVYNVCNDTTKYYRLLNIFLFCLGAWPNSSFVKHYLK
jgi:hypothetical protein